MAVAVARARPLARPIVTAARQPPRWQPGWSWLFVLPALAISVSIILVPAIATVLMAFASWDGLGPPAWVGIANFISLWGDPRAWTAVANNFIYTFGFTTLPTAGALVMALLLMTVRRGRTFFQAVYFLPGTIATVILARIWQGMIFSPVTGLVAWLQGLGVPASNPLADPGTALYGIMAVDMWSWWGFLAVIYFAALRQVEQDQIDAAIVDGATRLQIVRWVLLPGIKPTYLFMLLMTIIWSFKVFDWIYVLTEGGPGFSSEVLATLAYRDAFQTFAVGRAAAGSVVMSLVGVAAIVVYLRTQVRSERA